MIFTGSGQNGQVKNQVQSNYLLHNRFKNAYYLLSWGLHHTFASGVLFSTQISSAGLSAGFPDVGTGGIPGGNSIPGGGGRLPIGGGRNGGLCINKRETSV